MMVSEANRSKGLAWSLAAIAATWAAACSGPEFRTSECDEGDCAGLAGASNGGSTNGGTRNRGGSDGGGEGGEATGGSDTGGSAGSGVGGSGKAGADAGGSGGLGGLGGIAGVGGVGGLGGGVGGEFPATGLLDDFNREGPALGLNWVGDVSAYAIVDRTLQCAGGYCAAGFWHQAFGPSHEVFATLAGFSEYAEEINLVLAAQGDPACDLIEVLYAPNRQQVLIEACWGGGWNSFGTVDVFFEPGDQLGGRLRSDGFVDVFKNGTLAGSVDANAYPYIGMSGRIGVNAVSDPDVPDVWDDFGGGG